MKNLNLLLAILVFGSSVYGQIVVSITGQVVNIKGTPLSGASVYLADTSIGAVTNEMGIFEISNVKPGSYNIVAQYIGFSTETKFNVLIKSKGNPTYNFTLYELRENLGEVVIDNQNKIGRSKETPLSSQTLSGVEIATYPGGNNDVVRVAQSFPGVSPSVGGFRNDLIIRGGAPNESVYYLDGMEIPNINHFSTQGSAGGPVGMLNVSFINEVILSTSSFGTQYDNPLSGVLQFEQRNGNRKTFGTNIRISATDAAMTFEGPILKRYKEISNTSFLFSVRRSYLQALFKLIGLPIRPDYWDYQYKVSHKINQYNDLYIIGLGSIDDFTVEQPKDYDEIAQAVLEQAPYIEQTTNAIGLSWKKRFKDNSGFMTTTVSNNRLKNTFTTYLEPVNRSGVIFRNDAIESETKIRLQTTKFFNNWKMIGGFNLQYSDYQNTTENYPDSIFYSSNIDFIKYGLFVQGSSSFLKDKLDLTFGFRVDDDNFLSNNSLFDTFSPRVSLKYALNDSWYVNGHWGRYNKIPPYTVLGFRDNEDNLVNKDINYIESDHYVAGIEYLPNAATRFSIEGFYKKYNDYPVSVIDGISLANKGGDFEVLGNEEIQSIGLGRSYGLEAQYQQKLQKNLYAIFSYTYFFSEFSGLNSREFLPSVWDSRHLISFVGGYKLNKNWELSSRFRFAGKTPYVPVDLKSSVSTYPDLVLQYDRLGEEKINVFSQLDVRIDKQWNFKNWSFDLYLEVQNILVQNIPTPPEYGLNRDKLGNITQPLRLAELDQETNTPIPSLGIVIDF
jgi:hypothetical protein